MDIFTILIINKYGNNECTVHQSLLNVKIYLNIGVAFSMIYSSLLFAFLVFLILKIDSEIGEIDIPEISDSHEVINVLLNDNQRERTLCEEEDDGQIVQLFDEKNGNQYDMGHMLQNKYCKYYFLFNIAVNSHFLIWTIIGCILYSYMTDVCQKSEIGKTLLLWCIFKFTFIFMNCCHLRFTNFLPVLYAILVYF